MSTAPLVPASLSFVDGVPYAAAFGDVYHSADGGLAQARHVFLNGNRLPARWQGRERFAILETGFGLGLNFLATWQAWREDPARATRLHYIAIEKHPFAAGDLQKLFGAWPELSALSAQLLAAWPPLVPGYHRLLLGDGEGRVVLTLIFGDIADCLPQIDAGIDAFYLDGFAPAKNPEMWSPHILARLNRLAAADATVATYTVSAAVRRALGEAGFLCEKLPGFGRKREMLSARYAPRWQIVPRPAPAERRAIVIGAGLAGSAACERLAARGWQVTLIERHEEPAQEASGNLAGIAMPLLSKDDNPTSRLTRTAFLFSLNLWQRIGGIGAAFDGEACGVLQLAGDEADAAIQRRVAAHWNYPSGYARWLDAAQADGLLAGENTHGGWLFPGGGWVRPPSLCRALLAACETQVATRFARGAVAFERVADQWQVRDASGAIIDQAPVLILANGTNATVFPQTGKLPLTAVRGQVTYLPASLLPELPVAVCGEAYLTRPSQGMCSTGASYDMDADPQLRRDSQDANLARLARMLPNMAGSALTAGRALTGRALTGRALAGRVGFRAVTPDRLPMVGALPDPAAPIAGSRLRDVPRLPGLYGLLGYASRGLIWASFAAELLASRLEGEPLPVEQELAAALDPARFALKAHRRGGDGK